MERAAREPANLSRKPGCAHCGSACLTEHAESIEVRIGNRMWRIRQVPALHCGACGETFVEPKVANELHELRHRIFQMDGFWWHVALPAIDFPQAVRERHAMAGS